MRRFVFVPSKSLVVPGLLRSQCRKSSSKISTMLKSAVQQRTTCGWIVTRSNRLRCRAESVATDAATTSQDLRTSVLFQVNRRVAFGNSIAILGSQQSLGNWQPADALAMTWSAGDEWSVSADLPAG